MRPVNAALALGVLLSTAATDAVYVLFTAAVTARLRVRAATWSSLWYLLSAFAVISYTQHWVYVVFAALGSWLGAFASVTWLGRSRPAPRGATPAVQDVERDRNAGPELNGGGRR